MTPNCGITLRQLLYGRRRRVYRLLFSIEGETVSAMEPNAAQSQPPEGEPSQGPWNEGTGQPEVKPDRTHVFPVEEVSIPAHGVLRTGRGTVRWHPKEGVTFEVEGPSDLGVGVGAAARPGAGAMREMLAHSRNSPHELRGSARQSASSSCRRRSPTPSGSGPAVIPGSRQCPAGPPTP